MNLYRWEVKGNIAVFFNNTSEIVEAESEDEAIDKALDLHRHRHKTADYVDYEDNWDNPDVQCLGPVPEDQIMLRLAPEVAPQLPGFERRKAA